MSETMSNPNDQWMQFYTNNPNTAGETSSPPAPAPTTTARLSPDPSARVARPARRRTRASRRTPTTLLNTDTSNFRAMVQQFTGGGASGQTFAFSGGPTAVARPYGQTASYPQTQSLQYHHHQQQQLGLFPYGYGGSASSAGSEGMFQRLSSGGGVSTAEEGFPVSVAGRNSAPARPELENSNNNNFKFR